MTRVDVKKLFELPVEERTEITRSLLDNLPTTSVPCWHLEILRERLAEADANPDAEIPWEEVEADLWH